HRPHPAPHSFPTRRSSDLYTVTKVDHRRHDHRTLLGMGTVPPNNQGVATPFYNQGENGDNPAKDGVATEAELDRYTTQAIKNLRSEEHTSELQSRFDLVCR